jgi:Arc/MetJ-type ribon-helix-helix transcriptional regulator
MAQGLFVTITIRPEHEHLTVEAIQNGSYQNPDDLIARALEVLRSEDDWLDENKTAIGEKIERAFGQFERGEFYSAEESRAEMAKRKAEWLREHRG